jgi:hypothetical protein
MSMGMVVQSLKIVALLLRDMGVSTCFLVAMKELWDGDGKI